MSTDILKKYDLVYLASPYTLYSRGPVAAFTEAARIAGALMRRNVRVFSPIAHGHPLSEYGSVPYFHPEIWKKQDAPFVRASDALLIATMDGWSVSEGIQHEIEEFAEAMKPIFYIDPDTLEVEQ